MAEETTTENLTETLNKKRVPRFIDPYSDFGFKHLFGKVANKEFLIGFLNEVFKGRKVIVDIRYNNVEVKGTIKDARKTVYDLYCTGDKGEKFIVEMQKAKFENFKDRSIYYTANLIHNQGLGVVSDWNYHLPEIYFVAIMNFKFNNSDPDQFIHDVRLIEVNTSKEFFPKLSYVFIEMSKFKKKEGELLSKLEEWLYIFSNLNKLDEIPLSLRGRSDYEKVFEMAEIGNLTPEEMNEYEQSLKIQRDNYAAMETAKNEGIEKGIQKGREQNILEMAHKLKTKNMPVNEITEITGLSAEEIEAL